MCFADIDTRSGLKMIHKDFDIIQRALNVLYATSVSDLVSAGVVAVFGKLAKDGVLLRRLIKDAGKAHPISIFSNERIAYLCTTLRQTSSRLP